MIDNQHMMAVRMSEPGGPEVLQVQEVRKPQPGPGEVLVRAHTIGLGRPDCMMRRGTYKWMPPLPCTPGNEMSGTVEALGQGVASIRIPARISSGSTHSHTASTRIIEASRSAKRRNREQHWQARRP